MLKFLIYTLVGIVLFFCYIKYLEANSIFFPQRDIEATPSDLGLSFDETHITTSDNIEIHGWFIPREQARYTSLFLHGNAGNISHRLDKIALLLKAHVNIFIIDYRGYGRSKGKPSEKGMYIDTEAAYDYLVKERKIAPADIILYGESLGAAAAVDLAAKEEVKALILEGGFSSGRDIGKKIYPFIPRVLLPDILNSADKIPKIKAPKLFIHARDDEVVPFATGQKHSRRA